MLMLHVRNLFWWMLPQITQQKYNWTIYYNSYSNLKRCLQLNLLIVLKHKHVPPWIGALFLNKWNLSSPKNCNSGMTGITQQNIHIPVISTGHGKWHIHIDASYKQPNSFRSQPYESPGYIWPHPTQSFVVSKVMRTMQVGVSGKWSVHLKTSWCIWAEGPMEPSVSLQVVISHLQDGKLSLCFLNQQLVLYPGNIHLPSGGMETSTWSSPTAPEMTRILMMRKNEIMMNHHLEHICASLKYDQITIIESNVFYNELWLCNLKAF